MIVHCGFLGLPGEVHTRASTVSPFFLALQGADKFFTLVMRPVQPLIWELVMAVDSDSAVSCLWHGKHSKVRQAPAVRMPCIPLPVMFRNQEHATKDWLQQKRV